ncbi:hypothetical protein TTHERM_000101409 (macronuclear) [Tetrahymena thermophila SB210]|uniref:Uncharacterized protein n=1 Tax=Tetrahymena thermophila (strain SB210) TaxID=312017 RepID=W7XD34_TETTS|nr:hypothetical protein TTHERM_000101409 [Tetrahymena thermophila SB210]EWS75397.1 hypothetical protein TTHERM_000101409 [Tetrahymena thermophila SB210]|eukprot:XP_012652071.1 hypothetical protein TTHERM_000101409 [Tetrahymena thermophila SB210]
MKKGGTLYKETTNHFLKSCFKNQENIKYQFVNSYANTTYSNLSLSQISDIEISQI